MFEPKVFEQIVTIPIDPNPHWTVEGLQNLTLSVVDGEAQLGQLSVVMVVILNKGKTPTFPLSGSDLFPTHSF